MTFKEAFAQARRAGRATFTWNGKSYTTELAEGGSAPSRSSGAPRTRPQARPTRAASTPAARPSTRPQARPTRNAATGPAGGPSPARRPSAQAAATSRTLRERLSALTRRDTSGTPLRERLSALTRADGAPARQAPAARPTRDRAAERRQASRQGSNLRDRRT